jgi:putative glutamine amidotransferase
VPRRLVGITSSYNLKTEDPKSGYLTLGCNYFDAIELAGGSPVVLAPCQTDRALRDALEPLGGLVVSGGPDTPPVRYGQEPHPKTNPVHPRRDEFDFRCLGMAIEMGLPVLAICYGCQLLNIHFGGTLIQDLPSLRPSEEKHSATEGRVFHEARILPGTKLAGILGVEQLEVNSSHHQAVEKLGKGLRIAARSMTGVIEGIETTDDRFVLGTQWHPEGLAAERPEHLKLFQALVGNAKR